MRNILVLCHGNINRSPLAEKVIAAHSTDNVTSAGFVNPGRRAAKKTRDYAVKKGYDLSDHRSTLVTRKLVEWACVILYMDGGNLRRLRDRFPTAADKAVCLGSFVGLTRIPDPNYMAKDSPEFKAAMETIIEASINFCRRKK